jgi:hypothetical protein
MRGVAKTAKPPALKTDGFAFLPTNADFREGIVGAVEPAMGGRYLPTLRPPPVVVRDEGSRPTGKA